MRRHFWILADSEDARPNHHIIGIFRSEEGLIDMANEWVFGDTGEGGDPDPIKTLQEINQHGLCYYHYVEGE